MMTAMAPSLKAVRRSVFVPAPAGLRSSTSRSSNVHIACRFLAATPLFKVNAMAIHILEHVVLVLLLLAVPAKLLFYREPGAR